ncbi:MAG: molybdopterin biosynthesis protein [Anaerolineae bacterium]|nr:molybdopterin biosynthesis protein [Anaerolineae bacterium]
MEHTRDIYLSEVFLEEAWKQLRQALEDAGRWSPLPGETLPLDQALGRVTAEPVWARLSSPHYHACAMDGYALRAADTVGASPAHPIRLELEQQALAVDTGDPLPLWADAVVMVENVQRTDEAILLQAPLARWQNIRSVGEDIVATELLLPANHRLRPVDLGALAGTGYTTVNVRRRARVAVIPTGDELVTPRPDPRPGELLEYNSLVLGAQVEVWGGEASRFPIVPDIPEALIATVTEAAQWADLILLNAGSSAGRGDFSARVVAALGKLLVHGINVRPGHPVVMGVIGPEAVPIIGVPGYPVSAALTGELFVRPLLHRWQGLAEPQPQIVKAHITRKLLSPAADDEFVRVVVGRVGKRVLAAPLSRGAGVLTSLVRADGLVRIPRFQEGVDAGDEVSVALYQSPEILDRTILAIGSHDLTLDLMSQYLAEQEPSRRLASANAGSLGGLMALRRGEAHVAGSHLLDPKTGEYNLPHLAQYLPDTPVVVVTLTRREQGFMVAPGNPKGILTINDLARPDVTLINRQRGAGTRILLDYLLEQHEISPINLRGYDREEVTHLAVAVDVATGLADCGMGVRAAAEALGLDFVPVSWERYDLVIPREHWENELLAPLRALLYNPVFRDAVAALPGYDPGSMGTVMAQT